MAKGKSKGSLSNDPVTEGLAHFVADTYALAIKTQYFHWNVEGPRFAQLHELFRVQYEALAEAIDDLAERLRAVGAYAPGGLSSFRELATIKDAGPMPMSEKEMVAELLAGHEALARSANTLLELADEHGDAVTNDMLVGRKTEHDKTAWMLRAHLA